MQCPQLMDPEIRNITFVYDRFGLEPIGFAPKLKTGLAGTTPKNYRVKPPSLGQQAIDAGCDLPRYSSQDKTLFNE